MAVEQQLKSKNGEISMVSDEVYADGFGFVVLFLGKARSPPKKQLSRKSKRDKN
jgi:hypothetical protein